MTRKMVTAWIRPATGVLPPARMFVAVRAIAPVAGNPPNRADPMLAMPCASTSALGRCCPPIIRSATIADKRDSTAARKAMTKAEGSSSVTRASVKSGSAGSGKPRGRSPNREWIVSTGKPAKATIAEVTPTATISPGSFGAARRSNTIKAIEARPIAKACGLKLSLATQRPSSFSKNSAGTSARFRPNRSFNWLVAITIAIPMVKP